MAEPDPPGTPVCGHPTRSRGPCDRPLNPGETACWQHTDTPTKPLCGARTRNGDGDGRCIRPPAKGGIRCSKHGGASPQAKAKAQQRIQRAKAERAVLRLDLDTEVDPNEALLQEVYRAASIVGWLDTKVRDLDEDEMVWGATQAKRVRADAATADGDVDEHGTETTYQAGLNTWIIWWREERAQLARVAKAAIDVGVEERRVRTAEKLGGMLVEVIRRVLDRLDLTPEQERKAAQAIPAELRTMAQLTGSPSPN